MSGSFFIMNNLTVKAVGDWELDVLGVPYGGPDNGKDRDGEYFSPRTNTHPDKFPLPPVVYYHGFDPDGSPSGRPVYIGKTISREEKEDGIWYRVVLDKTSEFAQRVWKAAKEGLGRASSGSVKHLIRIARNGHIDEWPVNELTVFDEGQQRMPSNSYALALPVMKSVYQQAGIDLPDGLENEVEPEASVRDAAAKQRRDAQKNYEVNKMDEKERDALIEQGKREEREEREAAEKVAAEKQADIDAAVKAALEKQEAETEEEKKKLEEEATKARRLPDEADIGDKNVYAAQFANTWKYDELDIGEHALMTRLLIETGKRGESEGPTEDNLKALAIKIAEDKENPRDHVRTKMAMKAAKMPMKANELNQSTLANFGDEWVVTANSSDLWEKIRLGVDIVRQIPSIVVPQGAESVLIPLQSTSPTFFKVAQASAQDSNPGQITRTVTTSRLGTANTTLTVAKLGAATYYTGELVEDSIIPWAAELRRDMVTEGAEILEHVVIDGDTDESATTNINDIAGTPAGTEAFLLFDGFRKLALVTNTANSRDGGALAVEDFLETVKLMGIAGKNAVMKDKVAFILDLWTHWKALELAKVQSKDVFSAPTIEGANLTGLFGFKVMQSANMHRANQDATYGLKANTAGKVDLDTPANNTKGAILAVRWDQWRMGFKRLMTLETTRVPSADATELVALMRVGLINRDTEASAISYNIGV